MNPYNEKWNGVKLLEQANYGARARAILQWRPAREVAAAKCEVDCVVSIILFETERGIRADSSSLEKVWI